MRLTFLGATETVTGSRLLVESGSQRVLVDCGLFQGVKRHRLRNWAPFPVPPDSLDAVVLTHAHLDHSGYLPALVRDGFRGSVWCTPSTRALTEILLRDSAYLQEEEARCANRRGSSKHHPARPLYTEADAERAIRCLRSHGAAGRFAPVPGLEARFTRAGHILGAASVHLADADGSVLVSGDLGRSDDVVMRPPEVPPAADHVVIESTYGDRSHPAEDPGEALAEIVGETVARGGTVLVPVFAVGRAQVVLHLLARLRAEGRIPTVPTYLNSPMAVDATELFLSSTGEHRLHPGEVAALADGARMVRTVDESKALTSRSGPMIVLSASGMLSGGRVLHHLERVGPDPASTIVLAGYQAAGTRGEALQRGAASVRVFGQDVPIRCRVRSLESLSAHADADELVGWLRSLPSAPQGVSVVHGEPGAADALRARIGHELGWPASVPGTGDQVEVSIARPAAVHIY